MYKSPWAKHLSQTAIGDPRAEGVRMGPFAGKAQLNDVKAQVAKIMEQAQRPHGNLEAWDIIGGDARKGSFVAHPAPVQTKAASIAQTAHEIEAFGPVST
ncbi:MAG: hypothetical protein U0V54_10140 [Saprospiraceae bacterium]